MLFKIIDKYRKEAHDLQYNVYSKDVTWRHAILESIFKPEVKIPGKEPMSHLHPNIKNLHLPPHVYISDWRKYKVEDHPALVNFQKRCHASGLHDPWLRNYASSFYPNNMGPRSRLAVITNQCFFGFCAATVLYVGEKIYDYYYPMTYQHTEKYLQKHGASELHH